MVAQWPGELGEAAHSVPRELLQHATQRAWLEQLRRARLPVDTGRAEGACVAESVAGDSGDPQLVTVRGSDDGSAWRVDRRTMRVNQQPDGSELQDAIVLRVADLADRAQLELGRPLTLGWAEQDGAVVITGVQPLEPRVRFSNASYRRIAPLRAEPGTLCPLAIDVLDHALRDGGTASGEEVVRRIYARAYRRQVSARLDRSAGVGRSRLRRAVGLLRDTGHDLATLKADAARWQRGLARDLQRLEAVALGRLDNQDLLATLDERTALVVRSLRLLERSRKTTLSLLPVLTRLAGPVPRDLLAALAELTPTPGREVINDRLIALGHLLLRELGEVRPPGPDASPELQQAFVRVGRRLRGERTLGMDIRPGPMDESPEALLVAVREARSMLEVAPQHRRREAERELVEMAASRVPMGGGVALVRATLLLLRRIAAAKGVVADGLARALLTARSAVVEAGARLAEEGILDQPEDAFYLETIELQQALQGELGAYAARSRFRREDDQRWCNYSAPHRIVGRRE